MNPMEMDRLCLLNGCQLGAAQQMLGQARATQAPQVP